MKANRKFRSGDEAVSPVIAVILMVAITVVLAATVYVWVSGFGSGANGSPAHTMSMTSAGAITTADTQGGTTPNNVVDTWTKTYTVSSADPSLTYGDLKLTAGGIEYTFTDAAAACNLPGDFAGDTADGFLWGACAGTTDRTSTSSVLAGDTITVTCFDYDGTPGATPAGDPANCLTDKDLLILDIDANSVMVTLKVR